MIVTESLLVDGSFQTNVTDFSLHRFSLTKQIFGCSQTLSKWQSTHLISFICKTYDLFLSFESNILVFFMVFLVLMVVMVVVRICVVCWSFVRVLLQRGSKIENENEQTQRLLLRVLLPLRTTAREELKHKLLNGKWHTICV